VSQIDITAITAVARMSRVKRPVMDVKFNDKNTNYFRKTTKCIRKFILGFPLKGYKDKRIS